jgi:hypothetical protein
MSVLLAARRPTRTRLVAAVVFLVCCPSLHARTVILTDEDCDRMASIAKEAPTLGWAGYNSGTGTFAPVYVELTPGSAFLIHYPVEKVVPKGVRITQAEWIVPVIYCTSEQKLYLYRLIGEWGAGVSYKYRSVRPKKVEWNAPGACGPSTDRAIKPSATLRITEAGDVAVNVTQDVELWYSGAAKNNGWIVTLDDVGWLRLSSPMWTTRGNWKLRITYEPE